MSMGLRIAAAYYGSHWLGTYAVYYMLSPQAATAAPTVKR